MAVCEHYINTSKQQTSWLMMTLLHLKAIYECSFNVCFIPGRIAQSVTCLATDALLTADPGVASLILSWSHTFVEIDHELLVNSLFKFAQEKVWLGELTVPQ